MIGTTYTTCYTKPQINRMGGRIIENTDGTITVYIPNYGRSLVETRIGVQCCKSLGYYYDIDAQKCRWTDRTAGDTQDGHSLVVNPVDGDGVLVDIEKEDSCTLDISFDYLVKFDCEKLMSAITPQSGVLTTDNGALLGELARLTVQSESLALDIVNARFVVGCDVQGGKTVVNSAETAVIDTVYARTGFAVQDASTADPSLSGGTYYVTEPYGLSMVKSVIGEVNYGKFVLGKYDCTCDDVNKLLTIASTSREKVLELYDGSYQSKGELLLKKAYIDGKINELSQSVVQQQVSTQSAGGCSSVLEPFENVNVSLSLVSIDGSGIQEYSTYKLFREVGTGNLLDYLSTTQDSGFMLCDGVCTGSTITDSLDRGDTCGLVIDNIINTLASSSGSYDYDGVLSLIPQNSFSSNWLHFQTTVPTLDLLAMTGRKLKLMFNINNLCVPACILLDNVKMVKKCTTEYVKEEVVSGGFGFEVAKVVDNKKSWSVNERRFDIARYDGTDAIRRTAYDITDERQVVNTKEVDLSLSVSNAVNTISTQTMNNECFLSGGTYCSQCDQKQFEDGDFVDFQDGESYDFMDGNDDGSLPPTCCGSDGVDFTNLLTGIDTDYNAFVDRVVTELVDVKNRKTLLGYATLRALYDRYLSGERDCSTQTAVAARYTDVTMLVESIPNTWVELAANVIPSTTIIKSNIIYENSIYDQQKYKYRAYTTFFGVNPFSGYSVPSRINGTAGVEQLVDVKLTTLGTTTRSVSNKLSIAQMTFGSEFIGSVKVLDRDGIPIGG